MREPTLYGAIVAAIEELATAAKTKAIDLLEWPGSRCELAADLGAICRAIDRLAGFIEIAGVLHGDGSFVAPPANAGPRPAAANGDATTIDSERSEATQPKVAK